jgi:hypothetical protein
MERRNLLYGIILTVLGIAIVVVVVLILRKQATLSYTATNLPVTPRVVTAPTGTVPLSETRFERPWKKGDPEPTPELEVIEIPETEEMKIL